MLFYDSEKKRLIFVQSEANIDFWDQQWIGDNNLQKLKENLKLRDNNVLINTSRYLNPGDGLILEAGCGMSHNVAALNSIGFSCIGTDWASNTLKAVKDIDSSLPLLASDVHYLPFSEKSFIGYWSIGLIEHFWDGYEKIVEEMDRVIQESGYLFLTFPYMSPLRKLKSSLNLYKNHRGGKPEGFYQFALDHLDVIKKFEKHNFDLIRQIPFSSLKGLKDEIGFLKPIISKLYGYKGQNRLVGRARDILSIISQPVASHCILLILQKRKDKSTKS